MGERLGKKREASDHTWSLRVEGAGDRESKVYSRKHTFSVGRQASFSDEDDHPSAVEYLLGALGGDLLSGFRFQAAKQGVQVDALELIVSGRLGNPLVSLGVVGAEGNPGFESISATLYVSSDADESTLEGIWSSTLAISPVVKTLERCVALVLELRVTP
jgi:hypothetical protein